MLVLTNARLFDGREMLPGTHQVTLDGNLGRGEEPGMPLAEIDPRLPDVAVTVATPDRVDDALDALDHPRPVDLGVLDRDPEPAGCLGLM